MKTIVKAGDLVTVNNFQWSIAPFSPQGEVALVLDVKNNDVVFSFETDSQDLGGRSDLLVMFANDCKTMWVSSNRVKKIKKTSDDES